MLRPLAIVLLAALSACGSPRPLGPEVEVRPPDITRPTSSLHYRDYASGDALAAALRWTPGAPVLLSAHRGGPTPGYPENAVEAFENALNFAPAFIEMDVRRTVDGRLILMHDETLDRTTTGSGRVDQTTFASIRRLRLVNDAGAVTAYRVPTFAEALVWADGRSVLMVDIKRDVPYEEILDEIRRLDGFDQVIIIVYSLDDAQTVARLAPEAVMSVTAETTEAAREHIAALGAERLIAFAGVGAPDPAVARVFHDAGIRVQAGTFGEADTAAQAPGGWSVYTPFIDAGADVLATDNIPAAAIAAQRAASR